MSDQELSGKCCFCGKPTEKYHNYCTPPPGEEDCMIKSAKAEGGIVHTPNDLPIRCVRADGMMLECAHGDHPDYIMPLDVEWVGDHEESANRTEDGTLIFYDDLREVALLYANTAVAVTIYEYCYQFWYLASGRYIGGSLFEDGKDGRWKLAEKSIEQIIGYLNRCARFANDDWIPRAWRNDTDGKKEE